MKKILLAVAFALLAFSCGEEKEPISENSLFGTWQYTSLNVNINSLDNTTQDEMFYVLPDEWEVKQGMTPLVTILNNDNTWENRHYTVPDSSLIISKGTWKIESDSLVFLSGQSRIAYSYILKDSLLTIKTLLDYDQDGKSDDEYEGVQKRIK